MKLALGTANFGNKYSVLNKQFQKKDIENLKKVITKFNISLFDTAINYKNSHLLSKFINQKEINFVSKISSNYTKNSLKEQVSIILNEYKSKPIHGILFHNYQDLLTKKGKDVLKFLLKLKKQKKINKIGLSIYDPNELNKIWSFWVPDIVQAPFNVIDQRLYKTNWINKLKKNKIEIHARSCFLQGLLIHYNSKKKLYKKFKKWENLFNKWDNWCNENNISKLKASIDFVRGFKNVDYIILGFNNKKELLECISVFKGKRTNIPKIFSCNNKQLIEPKNWCNL